MIRFSMSVTNEAGSIAVLDTDTGDLYSADNNHPNWDEIVKRAQAGDESVLDLFEVVKAISNKLTSLSERVSVSGDTILFDGDPVNNGLTNHILRFLKEDVDDWQPLVKFMEKLYQNPNAHSREQLYRWLDNHDFSITSDGDIVGYKGVRTVDGGGFTSISKGTAYVNGVSHTGAIPNAAGDVITMPRGDVQFDPSVGCHTGLHVGTWSYASNFAQGAVLEVHVNPRDVVSVPTDCNDQKVRCCRYTVVRVVDAPYNSALVVDESEEVEVEVDFDDGSFTPEVAAWVRDKYGQDEIDHASECPDCFDEINDEYAYEQNKLTINKPITDTRENYKTLKRGPFGRFLPKGS